MNLSKWIRMKTIAFFVASLGLGFSSQAGTLFEQLCAFNPNWKHYSQQVPLENQRVFLTENAYIQTHLYFALKLLKSADTRGLSTRQTANREHLITVLDDYRLQNMFPVNYYLSERIPVFIDEQNRHCAVGYLLQQTGYENLALKLAAADNYIWVKDIREPEVLAWQEQSGFTLEELKLIQGAYDSYMPFALELPNRIEIPQKPEVITVQFKKSDLHFSKSKGGTNPVWIRGEGKNGVLHGRWEQNYAPELPWIVGFYQEGKREGKWLEYYQGTDHLCRTEHWKNDLLNGVRTRFDREGYVIEEIAFENGAAILKTNYDQLHSLKYVRKPLADSLVWTEIYDLQSCRLLASGHETIYNPGNLQWFQNIELTALNTMSLASQHYSNSLPGENNRISVKNAQTPVRLYAEPTLVQYRKQGDWAYYIDFSISYYEDGYLVKDKDLFTRRFTRFGSEILSGAFHFGSEQRIPEFDSLQVSYSEGNMTRFNGYYTDKRFRMEMEWYEKQELGIPFLRYHNGQYFPSDDPIRYIQRIKSYGFVNEHNEYTGKWYHFNPDGQLTRVEEFILPEKKPVVVLDEGE